MATTGTPTPRSPSSRPLLSGEFVAGHRRRRIFAALAELTAAHGYEATSITDIVGRAAIARKTLYDNFGGKDELLLEAVDDAVAATLAPVEAACADELAWPEQIKAALAALLAEVAEHPDRVGLWLLVAPAATPASARRYDSAIERFRALLHGIAPKAALLPETVEESLVGGVAWILHRRLRAGESADAPELLPALLDFLLAAYGDGSPESPRSRAAAPLPPGRRIVLVGSA